MLRLTLLLCALASVACARTLWHQLDNYDFTAYKAEFGKRYKSVDEHEMRRAIFERQLTRVRAHNANPAKTWKEGVNHMSDWTDAEYEALLGYRKDIGYMLHKPRTADAAEMVKTGLPSSKDWREAGVVTDVKDQGRCGSCWSFGSAETLESHWALKTGFLHVLSEQNILDCTPNPDQCGGTGGCSGGTAELAYAQLATSEGLASEWTYPYTSWHGQDSKCAFNASETAPIAKVSGYTKLASNEFAPLFNAIATTGPISISVEAIAWKNYESGIFDGCNQTNPDIDHAVQLVGYGEDDGKGYWLVRNSWTPQWGDHGYIKILRTDNEQTRCGLDVNPSDGSGCAGGPPTVTVCGTCGILFDTCFPNV